MKIIIIINASDSVATVTAAMTTPVTVIGNDGESHRHSDSDGHKGNGKAIVLMAAINNGGASHRGSNAAVTVTATTTVAMTALMIDDDSDRERHGESGIDGHSDTDSDNDSGGNIASVLFYAITCSAP